MSHPNDSLFESARPPLTDDDPCGLSPYVETPLRDVPIGYFEWMVRKTAEAPRVYHGIQWVRVMQWIKSKAQ